ncbi:MAG: hypothetical protein AB1347_01900 [Acidobacteriota bacterium]
MEAARPAESPIPEAKTPTAPGLPPLLKRPMLAGLLALFPGVGNVYNGLYLRGALFFAVIATLLAIGSEGDHPVLGFVVAFAWIFNVLDSYRQAKLINYGYAQDLGLEDLPALPKAGQGGLLAGLLLFVLGAVASLQIYFDVDLSWLLDFWPVALMAAGGWLIFSWYREKRRRQEVEENPA